MVAIVSYTDTRDKDEFERRMTDLDYNLDCSVSEYFSLLKDISVFANQCGSRTGGHEESVLDLERKVKRLREKLEQTQETLRMINVRDHGHGWL